MSPELSSPALKISGFGACMISGYPHKAGGMFEVACGLIERDLSRPVESTMVTLGGFPAPRAEKHLKGAVAFGPNYVVMQFGSTDAKCAIRRQSLGSSRSSSGSLTNSASDDVLYKHGRPATVVSRCRWELASLIESVRKPNPITPLGAYITAIEGMVKHCIAAGAIPTVLSPFVFGSRYSTRNAIAYASALQKVAEAHEMIFIDCISVLEPHPRSAILQHDGLHLSLLGHELVGQAIAKLIVADFEKRFPRRAG